MFHFELLEMDVSAASKGLKTGFHQIYLDHFIKCESAAVGDRSKRKKQGVTKPYIFNSWFMTLKWFACVSPDFHGII